MNEKRLKINNPNFKNLEKKMKAHKKRMKNLRDSIEDLNNIPNSKLDKRPCGK